eukprot:TRINITY_DN39564_c0_g1_i1.p1 TRINITY_DN39564_c0_g1~~TRINITY_DN39564_c0_g1_i1.p1  ORF type:complete len:231 (-),score=49.42 TRINITY_DN39564_c0_g1_i1:828-1520(-)
MPQSLVLPSLQQWLTSQGGSVCGCLRLETSSNTQRGLFAAQRIEPGAVLVALPRRCVLTAADAAAELGLSTWERVGAARGPAGLAVLTAFAALAARRKQLGAAEPLFLGSSIASFFEAYLDDLAAHFASDTVWERHPSSWNASLRSEIHGTRMLGSLEELATATASEHGVLAAALSEPQRDLEMLPLAEYRRWRALISARAFIYSEGREEHGEDDELVALYPVIDLVGEP